MTERNALIQRADEKGKCCGCCLGIAKYKNHGCIIEMLKAFQSYEIGE